MNQEKVNATVAFDLGDEGFDHAERTALAYCTHEKRRLELANQPKIHELRHRGCELQDEERDLEYRIRMAAPDVDEKFRLQKLVSYWTVTVLLFVTGIGLTNLTFKPFRLGPEGWLLYLTLPVASLFLVKHSLQLWEDPGSLLLLRIIATAACFAVLSANVAAAVIRGNVFVEQLSVGSAPVAIDGEAIGLDGTSFYAQNALLLRLVMALLAVGTEVGSGLAYLEIQRWSARAGENVLHLRKRLTLNRAQQRQVGGQLMERQTEPAHFEEEFKRNYQQSVVRRSDRYRSVAAPFAAIVLLTFASSRAWATPNHCVVVALDLTASVADARGIDGKSEMERNIAGVTHVLESVPSGSQVTVIAITNQTFSTPYVLLSARVDGDEGYFKERIKTARQLLVRTWQKRSRILVSRFGQSDIMGALVLASQVFAAEASSRKTLLIFSDMRQETSELNLARSEIVAVTPSLAVAERRHLVPDLEGVDVFMLGADDAGRSVAYWESLHDFWIAYFKKAGANLKRYSTLRELPPLGE